MKIQSLKSILLKAYPVYDKYLPKFLKSILLRTYTFFCKILLFRGIKVWPTKSYEVWLVIQFLLFSTKPKNLLELGSGRSTHYFSEYAYKCNCNLYSIEQNKNFVRKNTIGLKSSYLPINGLYHIPISGDWFDTKKLEKILKSTTLDFILVDAPGGAGNSGTRNSQVGNEFLIKVCQSCSVIVYDDTHRKNVKDAFNKLKKSLHEDYFQICMNYPVGKRMNEITFLVKLKYYSTFKDFVSLLNLDNKILTIYDISFTNT